MFNIGQSWSLVTESFGVLKKDKEMLLFPVLSGIVTLMLLFSFAVPLVVFGGEGGILDNDIATWAVVFLFYLCSYFIVIFFNVGLVTCAHMRLNGQDPTFGDGISNAMKHVGKIFVWALIAATVGVLLRYIAEKTGFVGRIVIALLGTAWSLMTFFVVPVMVFEDKGVFESIGASKDLFVRTWGENVVGQFSMGLIFFLLILLGLVASIGLAVVTASAEGFLIAGGFFVVYFITIMLISSSLDGIFKTAIYIYAKTGQVPQAYDPEKVQSAFRKK